MKKTENMPKEQAKNDGYVTTKNIEEFTENPFLEPIKHIRTKNKIRSVDSTEIDAVVRETGEVVGESKLVTMKEVDESQFLKVFLNGLYSMLTLSHGGLKLLIYILIILCKTNTKKHSDDSIYLDFDSIVHDVRYKPSRTTFTSARNELCNKKFLAKQKNRRNMYYINPTRFFKGCRLSLR